MIKICCLVALMSMTPPESPSEEAVVDTTTGHTLESFLDPQTRPNFKFQKETAENAKSAVFTGFVATEFLNIQNPTQPQFANPEEEALRHLRKAAYLEFGLDKVEKRLTKRYIQPQVDVVANYLKDYKSYFWIGAAVQLGVQQRFSYTWTF